MDSTTAGGSLFEVHLTDLGPDYSLVIPRTFGASPERIERIAAHVDTFDNASIDRILAETRYRFAGRHRDLDYLLEERAALVESHVPFVRGWTKHRRALLGSCFLMEYSIAAAALFNPSICAHFDQDGLAPGTRRVIVSLRAVGEGHISSILFRPGVVAVDGSVEIGRPAVPLSTGRVRGDPDSGSYEVHFDEDVPLGGRVLFPTSADESAGIEDVRLVRFEEETLDQRGQPPAAGRYFATATGYDGHRPVPKMFETDDFRTFRILALGGSCAANKDMSLFPRKIEGRYAMIGRQDGQRMSIMFSDSIERWENCTLLREPHFDWEIMQIGGCGSPIETPEGWLLPMHGVGPFRRYSIGFYLLDLHDPARVRAVSPTPALEPRDDERDGYVPNVVYSCGAMLHGSHLVMPHAVNDTAIRIAVGDVRRIVDSLVTV
ncbi:MAG: glycosidase [Spirochaetaceae bacterium]